MRPLGQIHEAEVRRRHEGKLLTFGLRKTALERAIAPREPRYTPDKTAVTIGGYFVGLLTIFPASAIAHYLLADHPGIGDLALTAVGIGLLVGLLVGVMLAKVAYETEYKRAKRYNDAIYRPRKQAYDRLFMCVQCGAVAERATGSN